EPSMPALDFGEFGKGNPRILSVRKRDPDGEISDRQRIAHQVGAALQGGVEHGGESLEEAGRLLDYRRVGVAHPERRLDDVLEIKCSRVAREMPGIPAQSAHHLDL